MRPTVSIAGRIAGCVACAAVAAMLLVPLKKTARAQGLFDIFGGGNGGGGGDIFGAPRAPQSAPQPGRSAGDDGASEHRHHRSRHAKVARHGDDDDARGQGPGYTSMCVRTCDGYAFPVGSYQGDGDRPAHEATCRAECPEAQTALYIRPAGSDAIDDAVRADTRQSYSKLPTAFKFKSEYSQACACHRAGGRGQVSFARDFTLRRGDVVMTKDGLKVFHGGGYPFKVSAFSPLLQSRDVARKDLAVFEAMNRARLRPSPSRELTVTRAPTPASAANP